MNGSSHSMKAIVLILVIGLVASLPADYFVSDSNLPMDKKSSNLREFMSAMKTAPRLRYGKRSPLTDYEAEDIPIYPMRMMVNKRTPNTLPELIDSLNGAERLRFGK